ncbi:lipopolysaccharide A protein [cyanobacterium G8-9]|nr:lipopolysaccharide A protein [cyanobacterium G8-9]
MKIVYYIKHITILLTPSFFYQRKLQQLLDVPEKDREYIYDRVNYYNQKNDTFSLTNAKTIKDFKRERKRTYFFDLYAYLIYFPMHLRIKYLFGDIIEVPDEPALLKSRPITSTNQNSIIMKLDKVRHFIFLNDTIDYEDKKDMLIWRGKAHQEHRKYFLEKFYSHPLCDVGQIKKRYDDKGVPVKWEKEKLSLKEHLDYKFILSIEGNDVASNLKWAMSSNSLVLMTKPKYETWFMEDRLVPNYHYILLKDDYSDLEEKMLYYSTHIEEAKKIIENAHCYIEQFKNKKREDIISLLVLEKYFKNSNQY